MLILFLWNGIVRPCIRPFVGHTFEVTAHMQTNHLSDCTQIWFVNLVWDLVGSLVGLQWIPSVSCLLICRALSAHLHTRRWSGCAPIWWPKGLINFWLRSAEFPPFSDIWFFNQFSRIYRQTADWIEPQFGRWVALWDSTRWVYFWWHPTGIPPFPGRWFVKQFARICRQTTDPFS